jgi:hypothetical protein
LAGRFALMRGYRKNIADRDDNEVAQPKGKFIL